MQESTKIMNGLIRIEGVSSQAEEPFEGFNHEGGNYHVLEMVQHVEKEVDEFVSIAIDLLDQYKSNFDAYRENGSEIFLHLVIQYRAGSARIKPSQLQQLSRHGVTLELADY